MANELKAAVIATAGAVLGAAVGGITTYFVADREINANQRQAADTFLLSQRQAAFAAFFTDAASFFEYQDSYPAVSGSSKKSLGNTIVAVTNKLATDDSAVDLVGPAPSIIRSSVSTTVGQFMTGAYRATVRSEVWCKLTGPNPTEISLRQLHPVPWKNIPSKRLRDYAQR